MRVACAYTLLAVLTLVTTSQGVVIDSESFEAPFDLFTDPDWTVDFDNDFNVNVISGGLSYERGAIAIDGGDQALEVGPNLPTGTVNNLVDWTFPSSSGPDVWFSFLLQFSETASTALPDVEEDRDFFQVFLTESGLQQESLSMVIDQNRGGPPGADHSFRARGGNFNNSNDPGQNVLTEPNVPFLVVGHAEKVGDEFETISIYVNPGTPSAPLVPSAMTTFGDLVATSMTQLTLRTSALEPEDFYLVDAFTIGDTYEDVVPADPNFIAGDFDRSGAIDTDDFDILADNLFDGTNYEQGDIDFSGLVDLNDFLAFRAAFAAANPGAAALAIPEPATLGILLLCLSSVCLVRQGRSFCRNSDNR